MTLASIETLLEERIGFSAETIGSGVIAKAVQKRRQACGINTLDRYLALLRASRDEWNEFVESVLVPETWFFRHQNSFLFLEQYIREEWLKKADRQTLRLLSIPCSSGEEPYSIAMTLFDAGLNREDFQLDAVDLSHKALHKARAGTYGRESFRGAQEFSFRERFFTRHGTSYKIHDTLRESVHFIQGNLLEPGSWGPLTPYDVIFCRNVLIYLGKSAKKETVQTLERLLTKEGILFVGHAERPAFKDLPFTWISQPGVFACRRAKALPVPSEPEPRHKETQRPRLQTVSALRPEPPSQTLRFERRTHTHGHRGPNAARSLRNVPKETAYTGIDRRRPEDKRLKLLDMARQLADRGKLAEALENCERVIAQEPANVQAYFLKGLIFQAQRDEKRAEEFLQKVLYLDPNHYDALSYLLLIAEHRGDREKARRLKLRINRIQET